jgi:hypothetical protein
MCSGLDVEMISSASKSIPMKTYQARWKCISNAFPVDIELVAYTVVAGRHIVAHPPGRFLLMARVVDTLAHMYRKHHVVARGRSSRSACVY